MDDWQPIETVLEGEPVLVYSPRMMFGEPGYVVVCQVDGLWRTPDAPPSHGNIYFSNPPTHWMRLKPPEPLPRPLQEEEPESEVLESNPHILLVRGDWILDRLRDPEKRYPFKLASGTPVQASDITNVNNRYKVTTGEWTVYLDSERLTTSISAADSTYNCRGLPPSQEPDATP